MAQSTPGRKRRAEPPEGVAQLPSGRHGLEPAFVARNQRERITTAIAAAVAASGYPGATVEDVISRAGVSRRTFYDFFASKEAAYLAAYAEASSRLYERVAGAFLRAGPKDDRLHDCLAALLGFLRSEPATAHMCVVDVLTVGPKALELRERSMREFVALFEQVGRQENGHRLSPLTAEGLVGGIHGVVYQHVLTAGVEDIETLLPSLHFFCTALFAGPAAGRACYAKLLPAPQPQPQPEEQLRRRRGA